MGNIYNTVILPKLLHFPFLGLSGLPKLGIYNRTLPHSGFKSKVAASQKLLSAKRVRPPNFARHGICHGHTDIVHVKICFLG